MRSVLSTLKRRLYLYGASYFKLWANISFRRWNPRVIAVTGSVGKTTMLHLLELQLKKQAHFSHRANSAYGVSFDILGLSGITSSKLKWLWLALVAPLKSLYFSHKQPFYVVEIDGERPNETKFLAKWMRPEVTLWISLARSHAVFFDMLVKRSSYKSVDEAIADEFAWLARETQKLVLVDSSNRLMMERVADVKAEVQAINKETLLKYKVKPDFTSFKLSDTSFEFNYPLPQETYIQLAMLYELTKYLDIPLETDTSSFTMPPGRSSYFKGIKDTHLIDSSYNAHLISMKSAVGMFDAMKVKPKWLIVGDMIEQGESEKNEHTELANVLADAKADQYVLVGRRTMKYTLPKLKEITHSPVSAFSNPAEALDFIKQNLSGGENMMFKGSQYLEGIIKHLLANPEDEELLCRREPIHQRRRQEWGIG